MLEERSSEPKTTDETASQGVITTHRAGELDDAISLTVRDDPGPGGAHHLYFIDVNNPDPEMENSRTVIKFQKGGVKEAGYNGISNEALLAIVQHRLECFQRGPFACEFNSHALSHVSQALDMLKARTRERQTRGVEGKSEA